jgi:hypothetical protein
MSLIRSKSKKKVTLTMEVPGNYSQEAIERMGTALNEIVSLQVEDLELLAKALKNPELKSQAIFYLKHNV